MTPAPPATPAAARRTELRLVVADVTPAAEDVRQLTLVPPGGGRLPSYPPGSHLGLRWRPDRVNSYSLTGDGDSPAAYTVSVLRTPDSRGGSAWAHELRAGDLVDAVAPRSTFPVAARARRHLLVAGGIGITPLLSHARWHVRWGGDFTLYYAAGRAAGRTWPSCGDLCGGRLRAYGNRDALWADLGPALARQPLGTQLYVCGPLGMIDAVTARREKCALGRKPHPLRGHSGHQPTGPRAPFRATLAAAGRSASTSPPRRHCSRHWNGAGPACRPCAAAASAASAAPR